jgi:hypothetical protein
MTRTKWLVIYKQPDESIKEELTVNVPLTVSTLEAQGFIIIDIVDVG